jgi:hypothetical protein
MKAAKDNFLFWKMEVKVFNKKKKKKNVMTTFAWHIA